MIANMIGIPTSAPKASMVPQLKPGDDTDSNDNNPMDTSASIISPPMEYIIPHIIPTSAIRTD